MTILEEDLKNKDYQKGNLKDLNNLDNEDNPKIEDKHGNEDNLKNEDGHKNEVDKNVNACQSNPQIRTTSKMKMNLK